MLLTIHYCKFVVVNCCHDEEPYLNTSINNKDSVHLRCELRRWAEKTSCVHLAPEYEYRYKHLMKAYKNQFKTDSMASKTFKVSAD